MGNNASGNNLSEGHIFVISDGFHLPVIFEFLHSDEGYCDGDQREFRHCYINFKGKDDASTVAGNIARIIKQANDSNWVDVSASVVGGLDTVLLLNDSEEYKGTTGNQPLLTTIPDGALRREGMSGGVGYDCPEGSPCLNNDDCAPSLKCNSRKRCVSK
ncbi:hypothetical protein [Hyalangium versicolor]|uniref:hypothetical protein n=1 Tax=Hyalangium versicolor TaxID=2861190 RepID=UPI001CCB0342|nr:hypothetical protein [Hyalangium versicolor]